MIINLLILLIILASSCILLINMLLTLVNNNMDITKLIGDKWVFGFGVACKLLLIVLWLCDYALIGLLFYVIIK